MFGQSFGSTPAGSGSAFGQPTASGFGQNQPRPFGSTNTNGGMSLFGQPAGQPAPGTQPAGQTSLFGQPATQPASTGLFGQPASNTGSSLFGAKPAVTPAFGSPAGATLGTQPAATGFGTGLGAGTPAQQQRTGTGHTAFRAREERDPQKPDQTNQYQSITMMPEYDKSSYEELRFQDYQENRTQPSQAPTQSLFGQPSQPQTTSLFGQPAAGSPATPFGQPAPAFGASTSNTGSAFGQPAATGSAFGAPKFGTSAPAFGQQTAGSTGLFGQQQPQSGLGQSTGLFGQPSQPQNQSTGLFGQPAGQAKPFGSFGQPTTQPQSTGLFGQKTTTGGLFGSQQTSSPFGQQQPQNAGVFGQQQPAAGTTGSTGLFGQQQPQQQGSSLFGQPQQPSLFGQSSQNKPLFGSSTSAPSGGLFGQSGQPNQGSSAFGSTQTPFGQQPQQGQGVGFSFGTNSAQPSGTGTGLFGQKPASGGLFGSSGAQQGQSAFGQNSQPSAFGAKPAGTGLFGSSGTSSTTGTTGSTFGQPQQQGSSLFGNTGAAGNTSGTGTGFSFGNSGNTGSTGLFGQPNSSQGQPQGQTGGGGLFGSTSSPAFGQNNNQTGQTGGLFGQNNAQQSKPLFGSTSTPAGQSSGGLFGQSGTQQGNSLFGQSQAQPQAPKPTTSLFGGNSAPSGGLFGNSQPQQQQQQPQGQTQPSTSSFGSSLFGNQAQKPPTQTAQQPQTSLFGGSTSFGTPQGSSLGQGTQQSQLFGQQQPARVAGIDTNPYGTNPLFSNGSLMANGSTGSNGPGTVPAPQATPINGTGADRKSRGGVLIAASLRPRPLPSRRGSVDFKDTSPATPTASTNGLSGTAKSPTDSGVLTRVETSQKTHDALYASATDEIIVISEAFAPQRRLPAAVVEAADASTFSTNAVNPAEASDVVFAATSTPTKDGATTEEDAQCVEAEIDDDRPDNEIVDANGYWVSPSQARLDRMSLRELRAVRQFRVGHKQYGFVEFLDPVDLSEFSNVHAQVPGRVVAFADKTFSLYPVESERPAKGNGFNVRHQVTLYNVYARGRDTQEPVVDSAHPVCAKFLKRLKTMAPFVSWDARTGTWTFRIDSQ